MVYCDEAIFTGEDCLPCVEIIDIPIIGRCGNCNSERKRQRRKAKHIRMQTHAKEAGILPTNRNQTDDGQGSHGIRYDDWDDEETFTDKQLHGLGLGIPLYADSVQGWLDNTVSPTCPSPATVVSYKEGARLNTSRRQPSTRRSYIPVPVRMLQSKTQPRAQCSRVPVPVRMLQKAATWADAQPLIEDEELFDEVTF